MKTKSERYGRSQIYLQFKFAVQAHIQPWMAFWMSSCALESSEYRSKSFCAASSNVEIEFCRISTDLATAISRLAWRTYRRGISESTWPCFYEKQGQLVHGYFMSTVRKTYNLFPDRENVIDAVSRVIFWYSPSGEWLASWSVRLTSMIMFVSPRIIFMSSLTMISLRISIPKQYLGFVRLASHSQGNNTTL